MYSATAKRARRRVRRRGGRRTGHWRAGRHRVGGAPTVVASRGGGRRVARVERLRRLGSRRVRRNGTRLLRAVLLLRGVLLRGLDPSTAAGAPGLPVLLAVPGVLGEILLPLAGPDLLVPGLACVPRFHALARAGRGVRGRSGRTWGRSRLAGTREARDALVATVDGVHTHVEPEADDTSEHLVRVGEGEEVRVALLVRVECELRDGAHDRGVCQVDVPLGVGPGHALAVEQRDEGGGLGHHVLTRDVLTEVVGGARLCPVIDDFGSALGLDPAGVHVANGLVPEPDTPEPVHDHGGLCRIVADRRQLRFGGLRLQGDVDPVRRDLGVRRLPGPYVEDDGLLAVDLLDAVLAEVLLDEDGAVDGGLTDRQVGLGVALRIDEAGGLVGTVGESPGSAEQSDEDEDGDGDEPPKSAPGWAVLRLLRHLSLLSLMQTGWLVTTMGRLHL